MVIPVPTVESGWRVELHDDGGGVSPEIAPVLFSDTMGRRASVQTHDGGNGVGLWSVKKMCECLGGTCGFDKSKRLGGAVFWFSVPYLPDLLFIRAVTEHGSATKASGGQGSETQESGGEPRQYSCAPLGLNGGGAIGRAGGGGGGGGAPTTSMATSLSILVIDVSCSIRTSIKAILETRCGHTITLAENGRDGLRAMQAKEYSLVLSDIRMPFKDGFEMMRLLRKWEITDRPAWRQPLVLMSANITEEEIARVSSRMGGEGGKHNRFLLIHTRAHLHKCSHCDRESCLTNPLFTHRTSNNFYVFRHALYSQVHAVGADTFIQKPISFSSLVAAIDTHAVQLPADEWANGDGRSSTATMTPVAAAQSLQLVPPSVAVPPSTTQHAPAASEGGETKSRDRAEFNPQGTTRSPPHGISADLVEGRTGNSKTQYFGSNTAEYDAFIQDNVLPEFGEDLAVLETAEGVAESGSKKKLFAAHRLKGGLYTAGLVSLGDLVRKFETELREGGTAHSTCGSVGELRRRLESLRLSFSSKLAGQATPSS